MSRAVNARFRARALPALSGRGWKAGFALALASPSALAEPGAVKDGAVPGASPGAVEAGPSPEAVVPPRLLDEPIVAYPEGATGDARVVLVVTVGADGSVRSAVATLSEPPFSERAEQAALQFRFTPATRGGRPVAAKVRLELSFREPEPLPAAEPSGEPAQPPDERTSAPAPEPPLTEVLVSGKRAEPSRTATLSRAEVREIPGTFGDLFRAVEVLPGVTPIVSGLPFFFIRGAPPGNVGYFLDGIRVPLLFHVGAGPSVVHPALMDRVDLYSGGYPARFGRFAGGIVAGEALPPATELHGEYNVRLFDLGGVVEAPFAEGRGSVLAGGRYSYTALVLSQLSPETSLAYWDYQVRASYALSADDRIGLFAFGSYDFLGERAEGRTVTVFGTQFHRVDLRYDHALGSRGNVRTALTLGVDSSRAQSQDRSVRDRMASMRSEVSYRVSDSVLVRGGSDVGIDNYDIVLGSNDLSPATARVAEFFPSRTDLAFGVWADAVVAVDRRLEVVPGLRADVYGSDGNAALGLDPRLGLRARVNPSLSLIGAFGIAHQAPAFVVPLPGFQPGGLRGGLQWSIQESAGIELDFGAATLLTATLFQNAFFDMSDPLGSTEPTLSGCAPGAYPSGSLGGDLGEQPDDSAYCGARFEPGTLGPDRSGGAGQAADSRGGRRIGEAFEVRTTGSAYGLELMLKRQLTGKLGGFVSYTLSRSTRSYQNREYIASFDRTHVLNVAVAYDLGRRWRAGLRTVFYTGLPKLPDPTDPDSTRLPAFFRLDARVEKRWQLGERAFIAAVAEWMNATLSKEAVTTTCRLDGCEAQMIGPVSIPSIGVEGGF